MKSLTGPNMIVRAPRTLRRGRPYRWASLRRACVGAGAGIVADVGRRIDIAVGVVEIKPVVLIPRQRCTHAEHPAVVDMFERSGCGGGACVVGVIVPFHVVIGGRYSSPRLEPVEGMQPIASAPGAQSAG